MRRILRFPELKNTYGIDWTRQHVDRLIAANKFPSKHRFSENTVGWFSDEIEAWMAERVASPAPPNPNDLPKARAAWAKQRRAKQRDNRASA